MVRTRFAACCALALTLVFTDGVAASASGGAAAQPVYDELTHDDATSGDRRATAAAACLVVSSDTVLTADVDCIEIVAGSVEIDFNGFTAFGSVFGAGRVTLRNGTVNGGVVDLGAYSVIEQMVVRNGTGFVTELGQGSVVTRSIFLDNGVAIDAYWGGAIEISDSWFVNNFSGVSIQKDNDTVVRNNFFVGNEQAVRVWDEDLFDASNSLIDDNDFIRNGVGIWLRADNDASGTHIRDNRFTENRSSGIVATIDCLMEDVDTCAGTGTVIERNAFVRNGFEPMTFSGGWGWEDLQGDNRFELVADDGLTVRSATGAPDVTVMRNRSNRNADLGIDAPGVIDGRRNLRGRHNGNPLQCLGVVCGPSRG